MKTYNEHEVRAHYTALTKALIDRQLTITTMESATCGQIASLITDTEGASAILKGAYITYSNEAKVKAGVPEETIDTYSVYSEETASAMAAACREAFQADIGIGVTGTMGNIDPANDQFSQPGRVYFAISTAQGTKTYVTEISPQPTRLMYKLAAAEEVYEKIREQLDSSYFS